MIFVVSIAIIFIVVGLISVVRPDIVRMFVIKDHRASLRWWGKSPEETEIWLEKYLVRPLFFRIAGIVEVVFGLMALYAALKTYIFG